MGIGALVATAFTAVQAFAGSAIGGALLRVGVSAGLSLGLSAFGEKKKRSSGQAAQWSTSFDIQAGADVPRNVTMGRCAVAGHLTWWNITGSNKETMNQNLVLSDGWCDPPSAVIWGDEERTLLPQPVTGSEQARFHVDGFGADIVIRWHDGRPGQAADTDFIALSNGEITAGDVGDGLAYVSVSTTLRDGALESVPEYVWITGGYRCHDPRLDPVFGGVGNQSLSDVANRTASHNPFVQSWNYAIGIWAGSDSKAMGGFADLEGLLPPSFQVASNVADEAVSIEGVSEPRYACAINIRADGEDHRSKMAGMLQAGAGWTQDRGGQFGVMAGAAQVPVLRFTDDDLILDADDEWSRLKPRGERFNQVRGQFISPLAMFKRDDYPLVASAAYQAADGERLLGNLDLGTVQSPTQAQRIAWIRLEESRLGKAKVPLPDAYLTLELGDWVEWDSDRFGLHVYSIRGYTDDDSGVITLDLQRVTSQAYGGPSLSTYVPAPTPAPLPLDPTTVSGFELQADVIEGEGGGIPALVATWTPPNDPRVDAVIVQYRQIGSLAWQSQSQTEPEEGRLPITGLAPGADYEVRLSITTTPSRQVTWTVPKSIKTANPPVVIGDNSVNFSKLGLDTQSILANLQRNSSGNEVIAAATAASGSLEMLNRYNEDGQIKALVSNLGDAAQTLVATETIARTSAVEALANQSVLVQAKLGDDSATGLTKIEASVTPDGLTSSYGFLAQAQLNGEFLEAGWRVEIISDGADPPNLDGRFVIAANKLFFDDGSQPFSIADGETRLDVARARKIESYPGNPKGSLLIDFENVQIRMTGGTP